MKWVEKFTFAFAAIAKGFLNRATIELVDMYVSCVNKHSSIFFLWTLESYYEKTMPQNILSQIVVQWLTLLLPPFRNNMNSMRQEQLGSVYGSCYRAVVRYDLILGWWWYWLPVLGLSHYNGIFVISLMCVWENNSKERSTCALLYASLNSLTWNWPILCKSNPQKNYVENLENVFKKIGENIKKQSLLNWF